MAGKNECSMAGKGWREHMAGNGWRNIWRDSVCGKILRGKRCLKIVPDWCIFISAYIDVQIEKFDTDMCRYNGSRTCIDESPYFTTTTWPFLTTGRQQAIRWPGHTKTAAVLQFGFMCLRVLRRWWSRESLLRT